MEVCSTTLQFCTSSAPQRDIWSCYRRKMHANTLLQNTRDYVQLVLSVLLPYEFTLLQNQVTLIIYYIISFTTLEFTLLQNHRINFQIRCYVLLPYEFTLLQNLKRGLKLLPVHASQGFSITFYYITSLLSEKTYWLPCLCKFVQLPCDLVPLQMLK